MVISRNMLAHWTVLVIDDEPDSLEVASRILRYYGAKVITANDGQEGLQKARSEKPTLIISNISMPVLDGWGLIYELKRDRATFNIPTIALTAHAMVGDRVRAISAGFHNYLTKPLEPDTFVQQLLELLVNDIPELKKLLAGSS